MIESLKLSSFNLGQNDGMLTGYRGLLHRGRFAVPYDRSIVQIEDYCQKYLFANHVVLADCYPFGHW